MWSNKPYTQLLAEQLSNNDFLIMAHRGFSQGNIVENTIAAMKAGFCAGADIVEMDVIASTDGDFYVFHDGNEARLFANETHNIRQLSSKAINDLSYLNNIGEPTDTHVETLSDFIKALPSDKLMNLDRGWHDLPTLLPYLDQFEIAERLLLKTRVVEPHLQQVANHPKKYLFFAVCRTLADVQTALSFEEKGINLIGLELIADNPQHPFLQADYLQQLKSQGYLLMVNSLNLNSHTHLWGNYDDDTSVLKGAEYGWGKIIEQGIDIIDTDWVSLLVNYRNLKRKVS